LIKRLRLTGKEGRSLFPASAGRRKLAGFILWWRSTFLRDLSPSVCSSLFSLFLSVYLSCPPFSRALCLSVSFSFHSASFYLALFLDVSRSFLVFCLVLFAQVSLPLPALHLSLSLSCSSVLTLPLSPRSGKAVVKLYTHLHRYVSTEREARAVVKQ